MRKTILTGNKLIGVVFVGLFVLSFVFANCDPSVPPGEQVTETQAGDGGVTGDQVSGDSGTVGDTKPQEPTTPPDTPGQTDTPGTPEMNVPDFDPSTLLRPQALANHEFTTTHFTGSKACAFCHNGISDQQGQDVSIETHWSSTMMANSTRDPLWRAKFQSEIVRNPKLKSLIEDKCTKCHAPMANTEQKKAGLPVSAVGEGFLDSNNKLYHAAMDGVSCTLCHQIKPDATLGKPEGTSGNYKIEGNRVIYGPYQNPFTNPMKMHVNYTPAFSSHVKSSGLCASCHDLKTPFVDAKGNVIPKTQKEEFPEQMVYTEWANSDYRDGGKSAKSCQSCHMAKASQVVISTRPGRLAARASFSKHIFVGGNAVMLRLMQANRTALGISANQFALTISESEKMLRSSASVEVLNPRVEAGALQFQVKVTNKSGHKLPSGYPSRRVFLHVVVQDASGKVLFESGKVGAQGQIMGLKSESDRSVFTPHYKEITSADQVQIYEPIMKNTDGGVTHTLLRAAAYAKDNRLLPAGFNKQTAPSDVQVHGTAKGDADFVGGSDVVSYRLAGLQGSKLTIKVELLYQPISYPFVQDLFQHQDVLEVRRFQYMWLQAKSYTDLIATSQVTTP